MYLEILYKKKAIAKQSCKVNENTAEASLKSHLISHKERVIIVKAFTSRKPPGICFKTRGHRAVHRTLCPGRKTPQNSPGVSRVQVGFLVGRFVFTPAQKVASRIFKETNHSDAFGFKLS